ncbi:hypothetical protein Tsubulata_007893 [Turnera subulata]|uniref:IMS import disulfide relay-system CHCH-CHCH-like Cx9C domain-containing protein n=1 Tax=Turnera subulata TaxID=218843 RepID=A0A9Q0FPE4_9ROSI|nr:hypothetical protein Tsubulata_007893 [Turnera subulata]
MGRKADGLYVNTKKFGGLAKPCVKEMISLLNCMSVNKLQDQKCGRQKELLSACMEAQMSKNRRSLGSINYHLQRLNRGGK